MKTLADLLGRRMVKRVFNLGSLSPLNRLQLLVRFPGVTRIALRLLRDPRVPVRNKAITLAVIGYILSPLDVPGWIPVIGQLGDALVIVNVLDVFIMSAPKDVVDEHIRDLGLQGRFRV